MSFSLIAGTETFIPGSEMPLLLDTGPPSVTEQVTSLSGDLGDDQTDLAVVDQQPVAGAGVLRQPGVGGGHPFLGADDVVDGDRHPVAGVPLVRPVAEPAEPDLRALQVGQDGQRLVRGLRGGPQPVVDHLVVGVVAVTEVHPGDVHAGIQQGGDALLGRRRGSHGANDFCAASHAVTLAPTEPIMMRGSHGPNTLVRHVATGRSLSSVSPLISQDTPNDTEAIVSSQNTGCRSSIGPAAASSARRSAPGTPR